MQSFVFDARYERREEGNSGISLIFIYMAIFDFFLGNGPDISP